jgi:uncharacterized membrane protein YfcA
MTTIPDGGVFLALLIVPFSAGTLCGLTGSGSAIMVQVLFRVFQSLLNLTVAESEAESNRRILAIAAVLSLSQYPVAVFNLYKAKEKHIRWDAVLYLAPGLNIVVWLGTYIAMKYPPGLLLYILGSTLIVIAVYQFVFQSVIGRKVDDEKVKLNCRRRLNQKYQLQLTQQPTIPQRDSGNSNTTALQSNFDQTTDTTQQDSQQQHSTTTQGTDLADLDTLGDIEPQLPKRLKPPNPSFDLYSYSNKNGLNLSLPSNVNKLGQNKPKLKENGGFNYGHGNLDDIDENQGIHDTTVSSNPSDFDNDDFTMISIDEMNRINDDRTWYQKIIDDAKNNPQTMAFGLAAGVVAGLLGGLMGINGPPVILYLFYLKLNGTQLRDTSILVFFTNLPCLLLARIIFNVFLWQEWLMYLIAVAASTTGLFFGTYFHSYCDTRLIMTFLQIVILLSSITLTKPNTNTATGWVYFVIYLLTALAALAFVAWRIARNNMIKQQTKQQFYTLHGHQGQS